MKNLSDQIYIEQLRQRLWANRGLGRAAVMVGAGFSRNAAAVLPATPAFPLWYELAQAMAADLYPSIGNNSNKDALRLATEYESVFGRDALNSLITRTIPDANYKPDLLHQMLLSLPWSDVFTTNYDTLLERALPDIHDRKYEVVLTPADLPARVKPRIVKLHGSFPSHLPFIVTQEDFRTYPREFAPFVNTVQQSIIENAFCLVGFSGEDPNFLYWTGWVRDHLGKLSPPIYLCSLSEVSLAERRVLEKRNVFPIDLSQVIERSEIPDDNLRFAKTLEWFLLELWNGAPLNNLNFPKLERQNRWTASHGVPALTNGSERENDLGAITLSGFNIELQANELRGIQDRWKVQRESYPGWVVLPMDNRERLWRYTEYWFNPVLNSLDKLPAPENLSLLYELNWRLEKCLLPIPGEDAAEKYRQTLLRFNPFPAFLNAEAEFQPGNAAGQDFKWSKINREWFELMFALMREVREQFDDTGFQEYVEKLREIVRQNDDWQARWYYEQCLFALFRLDHEAARQILPEWNKNLGDSFWWVKRAAILAEIGEIEQAEEQAEAALANIRSRQQPFTNDYTLFSQEGWTMLLLKGIKDNRILSGNKTGGEYRDRWEQLTSYRSNPWVDLENFALTVKNLNPRPKPAKSTVKGFSPDEETVSYVIGSASEPEKAQLSLAFLRMFEEAGLPVRSNRVVNFGEAITNAAVCLASSDLEKTISTIIRIEKTDGIGEWFHHHHVAKLSEAAVNRFFILFSASFISAIHRYQQSQGSEVGETALRRIRFFAELLSRLCFRLPPEQVETVFSYAVDIYKHPLFMHNAWLHEAVKVLFKRILETMSPTDVLGRMNSLLALPIPGEGGFEVIEPQTWIEPGEKIRWTKNFKLPVDFDRSGWNSAIENLLRVVKSGVREARQRAVSRLETLVRIGALTAEETEEFAYRLWSRTDPQTHLPIETNSEVSDFLLFLPNPNAEETKILLRGHLTAQDFPRTVQRHRSGNGQESIGVGIGTGVNSLINNIIAVTLQPYSSSEEQEKLIDWSAEETKFFLDKAVRWWDEEKQYLSRFAGGFEMASDNIRRQFLQLADLFALVLLPRLANADTEVKESVKRILIEMEVENVFPLSALPSKLYVAPEEVEEIFSKVLIGLRSADEETVAAAAHGARNWLFYARKSGLITFPERLLDEIINIAVLRRQPGLLSVIKILAWTAEIVPEALGASHFEDLTMTLEFLKTETVTASLTLPDEDGENLIIQEDEKAAFQNPCERLAKAIKQYCETAGKPLHDVINFWLSGH
jgi:tetratricopeptide (TPR) repeat protein